MNARAQYQFSPLMACRTKLMYVWIMVRLTHLANAPAHREPPMRNLRFQSEPQPGGDAVQRKVSPSLWFGISRERRNDGAQ